MQILNNVPGAGAVGVLAGTFAVQASSTAFELTIGVCEVETLGTDEGAHTSVSL